MEEVENQNRRYLGNPLKTKCKSEEREETNRIMGVTEFQGNRELSD